MTWSLYGYREEYHEEDRESVENNEMNIVSTLPYSLCQEYGFFRQEKLSDSILQVIKQANASIVEYPYRKV